MADDGAATAAAGNLEPQNTGLTGVGATTFPRQPYAQPPVFSQWDMPQRLVPNPAIYNTGTDGWTPLVLRPDAAMAIDDPADQGSASRRTFTIY